MLALNTRKYDHVELNPDVQVQSAFVPLNAVFEHIVLNEFDDRILVYYNHNPNIHTADVQIQFVLVKNDDEYDNTNNPTILGAVRVDDDIYHVLVYALQE